MNYLNSYEETLMVHYSDMSNKFIRHFDYKRHEGMTEALRARLIDWILHCTHVCNIEEKNIFFLVVDLVDLYFHKVKTA